MVLTVTAAETDIAPTVKATYNRLREGVKADGFRPGKAPNNVIDRELGADRVQAEVLDALAEKCYRQALEQEELRPVGNPEASVKKFVPYTEAEIEYTVEVMPEVKLADYKKIKKPEPEIRVEQKEVDDVLESLRDRLAERTEVERAAKSGDEATIDFKGTQGGKDVPGAQATDYPLLLGSDRFIPGFEDELAGLKPGEDKQFTITFPKDYGESSLAGQKVDFDVTVKKVTELKKPKLDDSFAKNAGPFNDLNGLKNDIENHLKSEKEQQAQRQLQNEVVEEVVDQSKVELPQSMVEQERTRVEADFERRLNEQGASKDDYLKQAGKSAKDHVAEIGQEAERRVKTALVLTEVANAEGLQVTPEELEIHLQVIAGQYQDEKIQEELQNPAARREIVNQMLAEKTVNKLVEYATQK